MVTSGCLQMVTYGYIGLVTGYMWLCIDLVTWLQVHGYRLCIDLVTSGYRLQMQLNLNIFYLTMDQGHCNTWKVILESEIYSCKIVTLPSY